MASPNVLLNNLIKKEEETYIDPISKAYFIGDMVIGINRLVLFSRLKPLFITICSAYSIFLSVLVFYTTLIFDLKSPYIGGLAIECVIYIFNTFLNVFIWKRLKSYYQKLKEFDGTIGCRPKRTAASVQNFILMCIVVTLINLVIPYNLYLYGVRGMLVNIIYTPVRLFQIMNIHFFGHLLSLLVPRLRLINYYMKISITDHKMDAAPKVEDLTFKSGTVESQNCQMKKLMDFYCMMISAYDVLIDAIKWQFVTLLTLMFTSFLSYSYIAALTMIRGTRPFVHVAAELSIIIIRTLPLFAPCVFAEQIQEEVRRLREHVASRLYEDKLNKPGRSAARALLALTEARNLSFSLLQIFDIDISLPFKFLGLLLTYLIILLQFEKFVTLLASMFISFLSFSYITALMTIRGIIPFLHVAAELLFTIIRPLPLFAPCMFADQIQEEVRRLREHIASRLYEDKLNKPGRSAARALLALTEARNLSFSLLQVFDIDISLPLKFLGLLLTYLIILLQFEKAINP